MAVGLLTYAFGQRALIAGILAALTCSTLGVFLVLRRFSLISDGLGHVSLAGIAAGIYFGFDAIWGAIVAVFVGVFGIGYLRKLKIPGDTSIAVMFSAGLALGIVLISLSNNGGAELEAYLFGDILGISSVDLYIASALGVVVIATVYALFKEFFSVTFDPEFAQINGLPVDRLEFLFTFLTGLTVVVSIKLVGILLVTSLIAIPAISSMLFKFNFKKTILLANAIAVLSVILGLYISFWYNFASGGTIVLVSIGAFLISLAYNKTLG
ncbi:MAG TPA: metal ABC transporter permease [Candidatus Aquilonibacter sp.]|nr:metal ABC transporter permease [Candidatus Aquilonibacter sp.]